VDGIPSPDTFSDVFAKIEPERFEACFVAWVETLLLSLPTAPASEAPVVAFAVANRRGRTRA